MFKKSTALSGIALILALGLTGCGISGSSGGKAVNKPAPEPSVAQPVEDEPAPAQDDMIVGFGEAITYENSVSISVSAPAEFVAGEYAAGVVAGQPQVVFTLVLTNGSDEVLNPMAYGTLSSGGAEASAIFDTGNPAGEIGSAPTTAVLPGQTVQWLEAYSVADPAAMTFQVSPSFEYKDAIFTNIQ